MNSEKLFDAITEIDEDLINEAGSKKLKSKRKSFIYVAVSFAACFIIVVAVGFLVKNTGFLTSSEIPSNKLPSVETNPYTQDDTTDEAPTNEQTTSVGVPGNDETSVTSENTDPDTTASEESTGEKPPASGVEGNTDTTNIHINDGTKEIKPVTLSKASYPDMPQYPVLLGEMSPTYDKWWQSIRQVQNIEVETENIVSFSTSLMSEVLTSKEDKNNIVSPLNIYMALSILAESTDGNSRQQILELLGSESVEDLREQANKIWRKNYRDDGVMKSVMANSLWLNDSVLYKKTAVRTIAEKYYASVFSGTMGSRSYNDAINKWIKNNTGGLLSPDVRTYNDTVMAIASTLLYQTKWSNEFQTSQTEKGVFHSPDGDKTVSFMKATRDMYYYWGEKFSAISLSLDIGGHMWFILPDEGVDADSIFADSEMLKLITAPSRELYNNYEKSKFIEVHMSIPKFDVTSEQDVLGSIKNLGVTDIADSSVADFSALATNPERMFIGEMPHGVRVKVDEEGVSAAAYTVIIGAGSAMPPDEEVYFTLDRPFAFAITLDNETVLFAGVVNKP